MPSTQCTLRHAVFVILLAPLVQATGAPFRITFIDSETERGIPLVELTTTNNVTYVTDSAGVVAFDEPGLTNRRVFLSIQSHGYEYPKDGFGYSGVSLEIIPGGRAAVRLKRTNIAERLYRITGQGIYRDSILLGDQPPIEQPLLNGLVMGQDSVQVCPYRGKLFWFWGDTGKPDYPLGNFEVSGAVSLLPEKGGLSPEIGVDLQYFVDERGFSKPMCPIEGPGPVWIDGLLAIEDEAGRECLLAAYARMKSLGETYERGLAVFNDEKKIFEPAARYELDSPLYPRGHPLRAGTGADEFIYFPSPIPNIRVKTDLKHLKDATAHESFSCLERGARYDESDPALDRDGHGRLVWAWKANTAPVDSARQQDLIKRGLIKPEEAWIHLQDVETGETVTTHSGSVFYNQYRQRWVMIAQQQWGSPSFIGEVWFAEADTLLGPWVYARKIVTHDDYSFYNVTQHPYFDQDDGRRIYFEGTYTATFSGNPLQTPRYDYNQIMYALSLDDPRLVLPVPVYEVRDLSGKAEFLPGQSISAKNAWSQVRGVAFFAVPPARDREGLVPVVALPTGNDPVQGTILSVASEEAKGRPERTIFLALPREPAPKHPTTVPLFEYRVASSGARFYSTDKTSPVEAATRSDKPLCYVWRSPASEFHLAPDTHAINERRGCQTGSDGRR